MKDDFIPYCDIWGIMLLTLDHIKILYFSEPTCRGKRILLSPYCLHSSLSLQQKYSQKWYLTAYWPGVEALHSIFADITLGRWWDGYLAASHVVFIDIGDIFSTDQGCKP
jgi:hypothetical protein